jgi:uncharacterized coiled-coil protein SlyX
MSEAEILSVLKSIDSRLGGVETRLSALEARLDHMETSVARQPDLRLLGHQMAALIERVNELHASNTRAIVALNDIARESVTPGEVEVLHAELKEMRSTEFNLDVRVRRIEAELHLERSP